MNEQRSLSPHHIKHGHCCPVRELVFKRRCFGDGNPDRVSVFFFFLFLVSVSGVDTVEVLFLLFAFAPTCFIRFGTHCSRQRSVWCSTDDERLTPECLVDELRT